MTRISVKTRCARATCVAVALGMFPLLSGCRKDLCYDHPSHSPSVKVDVVASWEREWERPYGHDWPGEWDASGGIGYDDLRPGIPSGIRAIVYGGGYREENLPAKGGRLPMPEGVHPLLFYNNDTEYIVFDNLSAAATASATTRTRSRASYKALHAEERTVNPPDMLYGHYVAEYEARRTMDAVELPLTMKPLTYTYWVRYEFEHGVEYVALARGALAGMAETVYLEDGHTGPEAATVMYDCTVEDGRVEARVLSFGVPNYPGDHYGIRAEPHYALNLEVRLRNGKMKAMEWDVTDQVSGQPRGGVITVGGISITDEEGMAGSGGFDVEVEGWGDYVDVELPLN